MLLDPEQVTTRPALLRYKGKTLAVGIRPEDLSHFTSPGQEGPEATLHARVERIEALGSELVVHFSIAGRRVLPEGADDRAEDADVSEPVLGRDLGHSVSGVARLAPRTQVAVADDLALAVDTRRLYFYDIDTSQAIRE
jgi:multiple sugar transport system ATP-binding protein